MLETLTNTVIGLTSFIGACSALAAAIPKPISDGIAAKLHAWLNVAACNVCHAENKK